MKPKKKSTPWQHAADNVGTILLARVVQIFGVPLCGAVAFFVWDGITSLQKSLSSIQSSVVPAIIRLEEANKTQWAKISKIDDTVRKIELDVAKGAR